MGGGTAGRQLGRWKHLSANQSTATLGPPSPAHPDPEFVVVNAAVFLDDAMMDRLGRDSPYHVHHANYVMLVFSAVNQLFDDTAFGVHRPYVNVVKIVFGTNETDLFDEDPLSGKAGLRSADAEVEHYLRALCSFQTRLKQNSVGERSSRIFGDGSSKWDIYIALTGLDLWVSYQQFARTDHHGPEDESSQPESSKVMGVTGVAYEGSACHASKNCAVIEFSRGLEMVDTITHEIAHMLGIVHDASKNPSHPCYERRRTIMARDFGKSRRGWSSCSVDSFKEWMSRASKPECINCPDSQQCNPMQCGGFCLKAHRYFNVNGANRYACPTTPFSFPYLTTEYFTIGQAESILLLLLLLHHRVIGVWP
ncbi:hypothetical protein RvY_13660 [Ramazzottius varieornatus]|uniref:Peptidase M12B domain-containing protein n=1 Tax=Ramazzottius varieornatus TaxID=947166 RepID=A0A1D1VQH5_RAMVA|nr:hypothetical protein RvY_13660 [Ramazzottius varieornatus]